MCDKDIELRDENGSLCGYAERSGSSGTNNHQTTDLLLSECGSIKRCNHGISKDCSIRYQRPAVAHAAVGPRQGTRYKRLGANMSYEGPSHRKCAFIVGVIYSVFAIGVAAASLGYRYDVKNDSYGFRALLEGTALLATITFIASLGLIFGVIESRKSFVSAWLVLQIVVPLYTAAFYGWAIFASGDKDDFGPVRTAVPYVAIIAGVQIVVMIVCTLSVNKFYTYLKVRDSVMYKYAAES